MHREDKIILLVEDNADDEVLARRAFKKNSIRNPLVVARDGVEALDFLFARGAHAGRDVSERPQLILLDLKLPRLDGLEVLRQIRADERTRSSIVVVLTSSSREQDRVLSYRGGANSYICKPVDFGKFNEAVKMLGQYWLALNEPPPPAMKAQ